EVDVAADIPDQVLAARETGHRLAVEDSAGGRVEHLDLLLARTVTVPVEGVQRHLMGLAVGDIHVDGEAAAAVPAGGQAGAGAGFLQGTNIRGVAVPGVVGVIEEVDGRVAGQAGPVLADVVAVGAMGRLPIPLRGRVVLDEGSRAGNGGL